MKTLVTQFHALNIIDLARGFLYPYSKYDWVWRTNRGADHTAVTITVLADALQVIFPIGGGSRAQQEIRLTYTLGPRGGKRPWFLCPVCRRRIGVLYHATGLPFRCRICCNLAYPSQYRTRDRSYGRQHRMVSDRERDRLSAQCAVGHDDFDTSYPRYYPSRGKAQGTGHF